MFGLQPQQKIDTVLFGRQNDRAAAVLQRGCSDTAVALQDGNRDMISFYDSTTTE
jgi:hypothetical protein